MLKNRTTDFLCFLVVILLSGCAAERADLPSPPLPQKWVSAGSETFGPVYMVDLSQWWRKFDDQSLNNLIDYALAGNPDRHMAEARIMEARGLLRSARSSLFPQLEVSASGGRHNTGTGDSGAVGSFYDAGFDASFEIDLFGRNRKNTDAAEERLEAERASYDDVTLTLVADVARAYIDYCASQSQWKIARKNFRSQEKTLAMVEELQRQGSLSNLEVERSKNLVNTTRASLPEFERQGENAVMRLSVLTGLLPENVKDALMPESAIPGGKVKPVLLSPAEVLALRPDIRGAARNLSANTALVGSATAELFPALTLGGFYGVTHNVAVGPASVWNLTLGSALSLLDFGRIEGRIDASRAREKQAYESYRKTILQAVAEVETALNDYVHIHERHLALEKAYNSSARAWDYTQTLFKIGKISFLDVLDAQRNLNEAESAMINAKATQAESLVRLFKSLGVY